MVPSGVETIPLTARHAHYNPNPPAMFETLTQRLNKVFDQLRRRGKLSEADVDAAMREVRLALLEADVHFSVVKDLHRPRA